VDDLEEELSRARVEDEDGAVDGLGGQVAFEGLVDCDAVDVGVVDEPDRLRLVRVFVFFSMGVCGGRERVEFFFSLSLFYSLPLILIFFF
jgi:hypothetical protein